MSDGIRHVAGPSLAEIEKQLAAFANGTARRRMVGAMARELRKDIKQAFATETAPGGARWKPLKKPRAGLILDRSGLTRSRASQILLFGASVRVQLSPWGGYHQSGTKRIAARPFVPTDPLPPAIIARYVRAMIEAAAKPEK